VEAWLCAIEAVSTAVDCAMTTEPNRFSHKNIEVNIQENQTVFLGFIAPAI
jgi:hypothetical protein